MGQAKLRGTYEERKAAAIERNEKAREELRRIRVERMRNETPEQRRARQKTEMELCALLGLVHSFKNF
jgi:hypothetical protein